MKITFKVAVPPDRTLLDYTVNELLQEVEKVTGKEIAEFIYDSSYSFNFVATDWVVFETGPFDHALNQK